MKKQATATLCLSFQSDVPKQYVKLRVTYNRKSKYYKTKTQIRLTPEEYSARRSKSYKMAMSEATGSLDAAIRIINDLGQDFDFIVFENRYTNWFLGESKIGSPISLLSLHKQYLEEKEIALKTKILYSTAMSWVESYSPGVRVRDIEAGYIAGLIGYIRVESEKRTGHPISENTIRIYVRYYRALFNYAIKRDLMSITNPVNTDRTFPLTSIGRQKAAMKEHEWAMFMAYEPQTAKERLGKNFFIATIQMSGANIGDILRLKNGNINGDHIEFRRKKTQKGGRIIEIPLTSFLRAFLNKYGKIVENRPDDYIMSFLAGATGEKNVYNRIHRITRDVNAGLKSICEKTGIRKVTTYTARHTYAVLATANGLSEVELRDFFGHANIATTQIYLSSIADTSIERNRKFLEGLMK